MKKTMILKLMLLLVNCLTFGIITSATPEPTSDVYNGGRGITFNADWRFYLGNVPTANQVTYDDSSWRKLNIPHDWSIELPFNKQSPATNGGGYLDGGTAWYRKTFTLPQDYEGKRITIQFEGAYMNSTVYINGQQLGTRPYGYSSFEYDITPYVKTGKNNKNVIAVKLVNQQPSSRWYSGSGIYRNVWLTATNPLHIAYCGSFVTTPTVSNESATIQANTVIENHSSKDKSVTVITQLYDKNWQLIQTEASDTIKITANNTKNYLYEGKLNNPTRWSPENPYLYHIKTQIVDQQHLLDQYETTFGVRTITFGGDYGCKINGKQTKIKGVCMHHDLGSLGAAQNYRALERQVEILKSFGCNAIRTAHNPPAPNLLEICDRLGMLVWVETFDVWQDKKRTYDYARYFDQWAKKDIKDLVKRDRNHPSVIMWSIGNEILEQNTTKGYNIARNLIQWVKEEDPTRAISNGMDQGLHYKLAPLLDLVGYNYRPAATYDKDHNDHPNWVILGSETSSAVRTRGVYHFPTDQNKLKNPDMQCSSYDNSIVPWGHSAEVSWEQDRARPYVAGQFVWTGFDYIGEPEPYGWPAKSSYFGIVDMCGFPKDIYYFYQSQWTTKPMVHLLPHWNWTQGEEIPVWAYSNCDSVQLYYNGKKQQTKKINKSIPFHAEWKLNYKEGKIKALGYQKGQLVAVDSIVTAGDATQIELKADRKTVGADGKDLIFLETNILDQNGVLVPHADNLIHYTINGAADIVGVDNGNPLSLESFKDNKRKAFNGKCLAIIQPKAQGDITITAQAEPQPIDLAKGKEAFASTEEKFQYKNVALQQPATAISAEAHNPTAAGNDGDPTTRWCATDGNNGNWWQVDLGKNTALTGYEIMWENNLAYQYTIETSVDNQAWQMMIDKRTNTTSAQVMKGNFETNARYVKVTITGGLSNKWASFFECKILDNTATPMTNPHIANNATDTDNNSYWSATDKDTQKWWAVDLGKAYSVRQTIFDLQQQTMPCRYKIETSLDNKNWALATDKLANTTKNTRYEDTFSPRDARYVRLTFAENTEQIHLSNVSVYDGSTKALPPTQITVKAEKTTCLDCLVNEKNIGTWINTAKTGWTNTQNISVEKGEWITISPLANDTTGWSWTGPNGFKSNAHQVFIKQVKTTDAGEYVANHKEGGSVRFNLSIKGNTAVETATQSRLQVLPNPSSNGIFQIKNGANNSLVVYTIEGKPIHRTQIKHNLHTLNLSEYGNNVYIAVFNEGKQNAYRLKLLVD